MRIYKRDMRMVITLRDGVRGAVCHQSWGMFIHISINHGTNHIINKAIWCIVYHFLHIMVNNNRAKCLLSNWYGVYYSVYILYKKKPIILIQLIYCRVWNVTKLPQTNSKLFPLISLGNSFIIKQNWKSLLINASEISLK